jgi:chaperonin GroEL
VQPRAPLLRELVDHVLPGVEKGRVHQGGGVALIRSQHALDSLDLSDEQRVGVRIVRRAIEEPLHQIAENAGKEGAIVVNAVKEGTGDFGYNAATDQYGNLIAMGVIDPAKVVRTALQNAASVAGLMLTTECLVATLPKEEGDGAGGGMHGGMGM